MKRANILAALAVFPAAYLLGSFAEATFNIAHWAQEDRMFIATLTPILALMAAIYPEVSQ